MNLSTSEERKKLLRERAVLLPTRSPKPKSPSSLRVTVLNWSRATPLRHLKTFGQLVSLGHAVWYEILRLIVCPAYGKLLALRQRLAIHNAPWPYF